MKKKRLLVELVITFSIIFLVVPCVHGASVIDSGMLGDNLTWSIDSEGVLTIRGEGDMKNYTAATYPWYSYRSDFNKVVIEDGVTSIAYDAFACLFSPGYSFTSVTIPESVTFIDGEAFYCCSYLESITIPDGVESIGKDAFHGCTSLTSIVMGNNVSNIGKKAFYDCSALTTVELSSGIISIGEYAFANTRITSVDLPNTLIEIGGYAFSNTRLTEVMVPESMTVIEEGTFDCCKYLTTATIEEGVTNIKYNAFTDCSALLSVTLPESIVYIGTGAFGSCKQLKTVYYAGTLDDWDDVYIGDNNEYLAEAKLYYQGYNYIEPTITNAELVYDDDSCEVGVSIEDVDRTESVIVAVYRDGRLINTVIDEIEPDENYILIPIETSGADDIKIFIWNSADDMTPLCETYMVKASEV